MGRMGRKFVFFPYNPGTMARKIFISYRRNDSAASAGRLYDYLENEVGSEALFKDVDSFCYQKVVRKKSRVQPAFFPSTKYIFILPL